jgi:hypothetical protein
MAIKSQYANKCKDCGTAYAIGDEIDTNGNKSPNKMGEMKDHWCKMGKNCQGIMQFTTPRTSAYTTTGTDLPTNKDPTPEQFLELGKKLLSMPDDKKSTFVALLVVATEERIGKELIKRSVIEKAMNDLGLQHPGRRGFIEDVLR